MDRPVTAQYQMSPAQTALNAAASDVRPYDGIEPFPSGAAEPWTSRRRRQVVRLGWATGVHWPTPEPDTIGRRRDQRPDHPSARVVATGHTRPKTRTRRFP